MDDLSGLEGGGVGAAGCGVDVSCHRAGTVLVDLSVGHGDFTVVGTGGKTRRSSITSGGSDTGLIRQIGLLTTSTASKTTSQAAEKAAEETTSLTLLLVVVVVVVTATLKARDIILDTNTGVRAVVGGDIVGTASTHEVGDHDRGVNGAVTLGPAEGAGPVGSELAVTNDGGVSLRTAAVAGAVTRSAISDGETRHGDTVGSFDGHDYSVSGGGGNESGDESVEMHFEYVFLLSKDKREVGILVRVER